MQVVTIVPWRMDDDDDDDAPWSAECGIILRIRYFLTRID